MNVFTDDDLKRLKNEAEEDPGLNLNIDADTISALLARLESAERMGKPLQAFLDFQGERKRDIYCMDALERTKYQVAAERIEEWGKSKGE